MGVNDIFLILTWVVGIGGAIISAVSAKRRVRAEAQMLLDEATFKGAREVNEMLREQLEELRNELRVMRGEFNALRAREGKLLNRIKILEAIMAINHLEIPEDELL